MRQRIEAQELTRDDNGLVSRVEYVKAPYAREEFLERIPNRLPPRDYLVRGLLVLAGVLCVLSAVLSYMMSDTKPFLVTISTVAVGTLTKLIGQVFSSKHNGN